VPKITQTTKMTTDNVERISQALDLALAPGDRLDLEIQLQPLGEVLYIHLNGVTILRASRLADRDSSKGTTISWIGKEI
jgi:hypothetical protein